MNLEALLVHEWGRLCKFWFLLLRRINTPFPKILQVNASETLVGAAETLIELILSRNAILARDK